MRNTISTKSSRDPGANRRPIGYEIPGFAFIPKDTAEAFRFEIAGRIAGKDVVVIEHITRLRAAAAPQWTQGTSGPGYYVNVDGDPRITATCVVSAKPAIIRTASLPRRLCVWSTPFPPSLPLHRESSPCSIYLFMERPRRTARKHDKEAS